MPAAGKKTKLPLGVFAVLLGGFLVSCERSKQQFLLADVCVRDAAGADRLREIMREAATSRDLRFIDNSVQQAADLRGMGADKRLGVDAKKAIDLHIEGDDGMGATAGNLGLPPYQVAIGFTEGSDPASANELSSSLVKTMRGFWKVTIVPNGQSVTPSDVCGGTTPNQSAAPEVPITTADFRRAGSARAT